MKKWPVILILIVLCCSMAVFVQAEESSAETAQTLPEMPVFSWKGYEMCFLFKSTDMEAFGLNMDAKMLLVRLAPTEGTIAYKDFKQDLFCVQDASGNRQTVRFFMIPSTKKMGTIDGLPADEQEYIDLLFTLDGYAGLTLDELTMAALEESEGEPVFSVSLAEVPDYVAEE